MAMLGPFLEALLARLCLFAAVLMGVSPSQELVLCFEPDGSIALEVPGENSTCDPCSEPGQEGQDERVVSGGQCCDCTDIAICERSEDANVQPSKVGLHFNTSVALAPVCWLSPLSGIAAELAVRVERPPGPRGVLAHIRTIQLRV